MGFRYPYLAGRCTDLPFLLIFIIVLGTYNWVICKPEKSEILFNDDVCVEVRVVGQGGSLTGL